MKLPKFKGIDTRHLKNVNLVGLLLDHTFQITSAKLDHNTRLNELALNLGAYLNRPDHLGFRQSLAIFSLRNIQ